MLACQADGGPACRQRGICAWADLRSDPLLQLPSLLSHLDREKKNFKNLLHICVPLIEANNKGEAEAHAGARTDTEVENVRPGCCTMCPHACVRGAVRGAAARGAHGSTGVRRGRGRKRACARCVAWAQGEAANAGCPMAVAKMPSRRVTMAVAASLALVGSGEAFLQAPVIKGASHLETREGERQERER